MGAALLCLGTQLSSHLIHPVSAHPKALVSTKQRKTQDVKVLCVICQECLYRDETKTITQFLHLLVTLRPFWHLIHPTKTHSIPQCNLWHVLQNKIWHPTSWNSPHSFENWVLACLKDQKDKTGKAIFVCIFKSIHCIQFSSALAGYHLWLCVWSFLSLGLVFVTYRVKKIHNDWVWKRQ